MTRRLTELTLARVTPPSTGRLELADSQLLGMSCRVTADGIKTFALRYRVDGRQRRLTLGRYPIVGLAEARRRAREALALVERGIDPASAKIEEQAARDRNTVAAVVAAYVERRLKPRTRRWADVEAMLRRDVIRAWGTRPIASITWRDVCDLIEDITGRGSPVVANRVLRHLRGLFKWAIRNDYVAVNPALAIDRPHEEKPRQRALSETEIKAVWQAFDQMANPFGVLGKLLLLSGQRRGEWAGASWSEIDLDRRVWEMPGDRSKTGAAHMLPLTPEVIAILETIPRIDGVGLIFPSSRSSSDRPMSGFSKALATAHRLSGTSGWTWHDLRRTCRTGFARLGVTASVGERVLNHADGTRSPIAAIYDVHSYFPEMRRALELWAVEVTRIVIGSEAKVVALRQA
jgi:integrase